MLDNVIRRLLDAPLERREISAARRGEISKAIGAAQQVLWGISAKMCVDYLAAWQRDLGRWDKRLANLPGTSSVGDALGIAGLR